MLLLLVLSRLGAGVASTLDAGAGVGGVFAVAVDVEAGVIDDGFRFAGFPAEPLQLLLSRLGVGVAAVAAVAAVDAAAGVVDNGYTFVGFLTGRLDFDSLAALACILSKSFLCTLLFFFVARSMPAHHNNPSTSALKPMPHSQK